MALNEPLPVTSRGIKSPLSVLRILIKLRILNLQFSSLVIQNVYTPNDYICSVSMTTTLKDGTTSLSSVVRQEVSELASLGPLCSGTGCVLWVGEQPTHHLHSNHQLWPQGLYTSVGEEQQDRYNDNKYVIYLQSILRSWKESNVAFSRVMPGRRREVGWGVRDLLHKAFQKMAQEVSCELGSEGQDIDSQGDLPGERSEREEHRYSKQSRVRLSRMGIRRGYEERLW